MNRRSNLRTVITLVIGCYFMTPGGVFAEPQEAQSASKPSTTRASQAELPARYLITVSEYRFKDANPSQLTVDAIADAIEAEKADLVETIMLSAIAGLESMVQFGRSVTVTVGRVVQGNVTMRNTQKREIGTILKVTASPEGEKVAAKLSFESSRLVGEGTDDSPPDTVSTSINTTQVFDLAKPTLISASTSGESSFIFITISLL